MRFILTDDAGHAAARAAYNCTSEVTEMDLKVPTILFFKFEHGSTAAERLGLGRALERDIKRLVPNGPEPILILGPDATAIRQLDDAEMRKHGWVRAKK